MNPDYEIEREIHRPEAVPCINEVLHVMRVTGNLRAAMVKARDAESGPSLFITLMAVPENRLITEFLRHHVARLPLKDASERLLITADQSFKWIHRWMRQTDNQWCWADIRADAGQPPKAYRLIFVALTGPSLDRKLCRQLTARGLPCKLT